MVILGKPRINHLLLGHNCQFMLSNHRYILGVIVFAQFAGTSLWFAGNAIIGSIQQHLGLSTDSLSLITTAVQLGFIVGTLVLAILALPDRISTRYLFLISSLLGACCNMLLFWASGFGEVMLWRFLTGFCLAGIYPIGMKIATDWFPQGLGKALGLLVGALVLGTSFPHFLRSNPTLFGWGQLLFSTSFLAVLGGVSLFCLVPIVHKPREKSSFQFGSIFKAFQYPTFRAASLGYFGHMWELYTFWAFLPIIIQFYNQLHPAASLNVSFWSFVIIALGMLSCVVGGFLSERIGSASVSFYALLISGTCCLVSPFIFNWDTAIFLIFLLVWGMSVVADSPQLSSLVARYAPPQLKGTALTLSTCIGFSITIISIQLLNELSYVLATPFLFLFLAPGPIVGMLAMKRLLNKNGQ